MIKSIISAFFIFIFTILSFTHNTYGFWGEDQNSCILNYSKKSKSNKGAALAKRYCKKKHLERTDNDPNAKREQFIAKCVLSDLEDMPNDEAASNLVRICKEKADKKLPYVKPVEYVSIDHEIGLVINNVPDTLITERFWDELASMLYFTGFDVSKLSPKYVSKQIVVKNTVGGEDIKSKAQCQEIFTALRLIDFAGSLCDELFDRYLYNNSIILMNTKHRIKCILEKTQTVESLSPMSKREMGNLCRAEAFSKYPYGQEQILNWDDYEVEWEILVKAFNAKL